MCSNHTRSILTYLHVSKLILSQYLGTTGRHNTWSHCSKGHTHELILHGTNVDWGGGCMVGWLTFAVTLWKLHTHCFWWSVIWPIYIAIRKGTWLKGIKFIYFWCNFFCLTFMKRNTKDFWTFYIVTFGPTIFSLRVFSWIDAIPIL